MAQVDIVGGSVDSSELGVTLMHEHVFVLTPDVLANYPTSDWDEEHRIADAVAKLTELRALGVQTILDPTVVGLGRDLARVARVAEQVDIRIVAATGLYTYDVLPPMFSYVGPGTLAGGDDPMVAMFVGDLTDGVAATGIRAAFLKCAIDQPGLTPGVERVMRAVARAHRLTGAPITVHTSVHNQSGLEAQRVFREEGVDLSRVVIGHCGDTTDLDYLRRLADEGSLLGMDRFGLDVLLPTADRVDTVVSLCEAGYADRMVLAHDAACYIDWFGPGMVDAFAPHWNYRHLSTDVLPALAERGVTDEQVATMMVDNPRRYFEHGGAY